MRVVSADGLFHIDPMGQLVSMTVAPYEAEEILQELLVTHPDLLAGGQMTPHEPRRWTLVKREHGVPDGEAGTARWSIDHLFVDQDAVPTLVEVKRSSDTRIRREVVGQMLDYAANGVRYWAVEELRATFEATQRDIGSEPVAVIAGLCGDQDMTYDEFFLRVGDNLRAGRIRMVFVADVIPDELMRITEFLNEQMRPAEVFAVEVRQYKADAYPGTVIVPAVYGRTAGASVKSAPRSAPDRAAALSQSAASTIELLDLVTGLATDLGLVVHETPSGLLVKTNQRRSVANVYLAPYDAIDVPLKPLRERGWAIQADEILGQLRQLTTKPLTVKSPSLPSPDAVLHWEQVRALLEQVATLYLADDLDMPHSPGPRLRRS